MRPSRLWQKLNELHCYIFDHDWHDRTFGVVCRRCHTWSPTLPGYGRFPIWKRHILRGEE